MDKFPMFVFFLILGLSFYISDKKDQARDNEYKKEMNCIKKLSNTDYTLSILPKGCNDDPCISAFMEEWITECKKRDVP